MVSVVKPINMGSELKKILEEFSEVSEKKAERALRATVIKVWGDIITQTPVGNPDIWKSESAKKYAKDTGYKGGTARGNWFIGGEVTDKMHNIAKSNKGSNYVKSNTNRKLFGSKLYMFNNLPYIERLEFGAWSTQAPSGMLRRNVAAFPNILRRAFEKV